MKTFIEFCLDSKKELPILEKTVRRFMWMVVKINKTPGYTIPD